MAQRSASAVACALAFASAEDRHVAALDLAIYAANLVGSAIATLK